MTIFDKEFWKDIGYILRDCSLSKEWINNEEYNLYINIDVQKVTTIDKIICELIIS